MAGDRFLASVLVVGSGSGPGCPARVLTNAGYGVHLVSTAREAQVLCQALRPDLIVLDAWLPDTDGVTAIRNWAGCGDCTAAVILLAPPSTRIGTLEAARLGVAAILAWPAQPQTLLRVCRHSLVFAGDEGSVGSVIEHAAHQAPQPSSADPPSAGRPVGLATLTLDQPYRQAREAFEQAFITYHLACEQGCVRRVASKTGMDYSSLYRTIKRWGVAFGKRSTTHE
jgi:DNA-binding NtrC family response regulator